MNDLIIAEMRVSSHGRFASHNFEYKYFAYVTDVTTDFYMNGNQHVSECYGQQNKDTIHSYREEQKHMYDIQIRIPCANVSNTNTLHRWCCYCYWCCLCIRITNQARDIHRTFF